MCLKKIGLFLVIPSLVFAACFALAPAVWPSRPATADVHRRTCAGSSDGPADLVAGLAWEYLYKMGT